MVQNSIRGGFSHAGLRPTRPATLRVAVAAALVLAGSAANAHTKAIGYHNAGAAGSVTFWYQSWHACAAPFLEGDFNLVGINGNTYPSTTVAFTLSTCTKPALLVDGVNNFYACTSNPNGFCATDEDAPPIGTKWQGVTMTGLTAGEYRFTYIPIANPSLDWTPATAGVLSNTFVITEEYIDDCPTDAVILNTGYDHLNGGVLAIGAIDPRWTVVADPFALTSEPRPATVITKHAAWAVPDVDSQWISGYPTSIQTQNGDYVFETTFCVLPGVDLGAATLQIGMRGDDACFASLNGGSEFHTGDAFSDATLTIGNYSLATIGGVNGPNTLRIRVANVFNVAMGLDLVATVLASPNGTAERPECCLGVGALQGLVFKDLNANGVRDFGETPIQGRRIRLESLTGASVRYETHTDVTGFYNFAGVPQGTYLLTEWMNLSWAQTAPPSAGHTVTLQGIQGITGLDFGNAKTLIAPRFPWFTVAPYPGPPVVYIR
jgi:hypothetical protein